MTRQIVLVRHPAVTSAFAGRCYGSTDVPLGPEGEAQAARLAEALAAQPISHLHHSDLGRCQGLAQRLAALAGVVPLPEARLRERSFGEWEGRTWDEIYRETGDAMMGLVMAPATWHPPGGETTFALRDRMWSWFAGLPPTGRIVAITHGGPIAALRGSLRGLPVKGWVDLIPALGEVIELEVEGQRPGSGNAGW